MLFQDGSFCSSCVLNFLLVSGLDIFIVLLFASVDVSTDFILKESRCFNLCNFNSLNII